MDTTAPHFVLAGNLKELKAKGRLVVHGRHRPVLLVHEDGHVFALDNRCPHMGFPLDRGSVEDGILTCHWHHARFELASGCTFDLWADDVPTCPVEIRAGGEIWVKPVFGYTNPAEHWRRRLEDGLAHNLSLVIAKAVLGLLAAGQSPSEVVRQAALFGTRNRDGWDTGLTILTALGQLLPFLSEEETHLALFHGVRRVAADCDGATPRREREPLASRPDFATLQRWLRRWVAVRHRDAAERTVLTAIARGASPAALADLLFAAETDRAYADGGHSFDFINKAFECLDVIGWEYAADVLPSVVGQMAAARGAEERTAWRQPVDLIALCQRAGAELPHLFAARDKSRHWLDHISVSESLLGDAALLDAFDRQRQIDAAARLVARFLTLGHPPETLIATLAQALLREDAGFHAYQILEAGVRQFHEWGNGDQGRHILIAVSRYLAAHFPTQRALLQTADIATRLMRGGELHREADVVA